MDPVTGTQCYCNKETGIKSDTPLVRAVDAETVSTCAAAEDREPDKGLLLAGWEVKTDPNTGEVMYYNPETDALTSTRPGKTPPDSRPVDALLRISCCLSATFTSPN